MSQTQPRYQRTTGGLIGAMVMVLIVVLGYVVIRALNRDNEPTPVPTVDYTNWVRSGRADGKLHIFVPPRMPTGWRATSATYTTGLDPHWHLGMLTKAGDYVGIEESLDSTDDVVHQYVDDNARHDGSVTVSGQEWQVWRDSGGDYGLVRTTPAPKGDIPETLLVVGSAPDSQVRTFAASLTS